MSQENVEIVRTFLDQYGSTTDMLRLVADFWEPEADFYPVRKFPEARPCHGVEEVARFLTAFRDAWDRYEMGVKKLIPVSDDRVLVHSVLRAEGRESGVKLEGDLYQCLWLRHGRFFRVEDHLTLKGALRALGLSAEAIEAVGLSEQAMSPENVEVENPVVRRLFWAFENDTEAFRDALHPEIEWFPIEEERTRLYGVEAAMRNRNQWLDTWAEHRFDLEQVIEKGNSVVVSVHITARGKGSGVEVDVRFYPHIKLRDDKVVYIFDHETRAEALEAVGLSE